MRRPIRTCAGCKRRRACSLPILPPFEPYCDSCMLYAVWIDTQRILSAIRMVLYAEPATMNKALAQFADIIKAARGD